MTVCVFVCVLPAAAIHTLTITLFIQLRDNEQLDLVLFTLCICITYGEIGVSALHARVAAVRGGDGAIVCPRTDDFRMDASSRSGPSAGRLKMGKETTLIDAA